MNIPKLDLSEFHKISSLMYQSAGVYLASSKRDLVRSRLAKRLRFYGFQGFRPYLELLESGNRGDEMETMVDLLTTHKTSFFRESQHFDFLKQLYHSTRFLPPDELKFWSAGCSFGHEPYSLAICMSEWLPAAGRKVRILATDICRPALEKARSATYQREELEGLSPELIRKYLQPSPETDSTFHMKLHIREMVRFARLNLVGQWPMKGPFEAIFCRNVMIYFDTDVRQALIERFYRLLRLGGHLFIGHSESLNGLAHGFRMVQPAVYVRDGS